MSCVDASPTWVTFFSVCKTFCCDKLISMPFLQFRHVRLSVVWCPWYRMKLTFAVVSYEVLLLDIMSSKLFCRISLPNYIYQLSLRTTSCFRIESSDFFRNTSRDVPCWSYCVFLDVFDFVLALVSSMLFLSYILICLWSSISSTQTLETGLNSELNLPTSSATPRSMFHAGLIVSF